MFSNFLDAASKAAEAAKTSADKMMKDAEQNLQSLSERIEAKASPTRETEEKNEESTPAPPPAPAKTEEGKEDTTSAEEAPVEKEDSVSALTEAMKKNALNMGSFLSRMGEKASETAKLAQQRAEETSKQLQQKAEEAGYGSHLESFKTHLKEAQETIAQEAVSFKEELKLTVAEEKEHVQKSAVEYKQECHEIAGVLQEKIQTAMERSNLFEGPGGGVSCVTKRIHVINYPLPQHVPHVAKRLNRLFGEKYLVFNLSERGYDSADFLGHVMDIQYRGLPAAPTDLLCELCMSAHRWLAQDSENVLVVHCFGGFTRSATFLACYLTWTNAFEHGTDALPFVCDRLKNKQLRAVQPSQRRYINYFQQVLAGKNPQCSPVRLNRLILNGIPNFSKDESNPSFTPFVELWQRGECIWTSLQTLGVGDTKQTVSPTVYSNADPSISMDINFVCSGDLLLRVRHFEDEEHLESALRITFHSAFLPEKYIKNYEKFKNVENL